MHALLLVGGFCIMVIFIYLTWDFHSYSAPRQAIVAVGLATSAINMYGLIIDSPRAAWVSLFVAVITICYGMLLFFCGSPAASAE